MITEKDTGKRVLITKDDKAHWPKEIIFPVQGTIKKVHPDTLAIEFDFENKLFHDCDGYTEWNKGWFISQEDCTIIDEPLTICDDYVDKIRKELLGMRVNAVEFLLIEKLLGKTMELKEGLVRFKHAKGMDK